jgi:hypothetical protein
VLGCRYVPRTSAWGPPSPREVTRLRGIFRDGNGLLRTIFAANSHINTSISQGNANTGDRTRLANFRNVP